MTQISESLAPESEPGQPDMIAQTASGDIAVEVTSLLASSRDNIQTVQNSVEHPVYKAISQKKGQFKRWKRELKIPLILAVCSEVPPPGMSFPGGTCNTTTAQAVAAALLDERLLGPEETVSVTAAYSHRRLRVSGSDALSAIVVVTLATEYKSLKKRPDAEIFLNPHAAVPLPQTTYELFKRIELGSIDFGMGWVDWSAQDKGDPGKRAERRLTGGLVVTPNSVEIPQSILTELLAGITTPDELFTAKNWNYTAVLRNFLQENREIVSIELLNPECGSREDSKVRIVWSDPPEPVIATRKR